MRNAPPTTTTIVLQAPAADSHDESLQLAREQTRWTYYGTILTAVGTLLAVIGATVAFAHWVKSRRARKLRASQPNDSSSANSIAAEKSPALVEHERFAASVRLAVKDVEEELRHLLDQRAMLRAKRRDCDERLAASRLAISDNEIEINAVAKEIEATESDSESITLGEMAMMARREEALEAKLTQLRRHSRELTERITLLKQDQEALASDEEKVSHVIAARSQILAESVRRIDESRLRVMSSAP